MPARGLPRAMSRERGPSGVGATLSVVVGLLLVGYGVMLVGTSLLAAAWVAAVGVCVAASGVVATPWAGERFGISPRRQRRMSTALGVLGVLLAVAYLLTNGATFSGGSASGVIGVR